MPRRERPVQHVGLQSVVIKTPLHNIVALQRCAAPQPAEETQRRRVRVYQSPRVVNDQRWKRIVALKQRLELAAKRRQFAAVDRALPIHGSKPGREQQLVARSERHGQCFTQHHHRAAAWPCASRLNKTQMPLGIARDHRQFKLGLAARFAPPSQVASKRIRFRSAYSDRHAGTPNRSRQRQALFIWDLS